jgi:voltage-gated potassium channel Kch
VEDLHGSRLVIRVGDPTRTTDLALVGLERARTVIVLADDDADSDAGVVRTTLAAHSILAGSDRVPLIVEVTEPVTGESLVRACGQGVHPVMPTQTIARVAAFTLRQPGLNQVIQELLDYHNADLHIFDLGDLSEEVGELINVCFADTLLMFDKARPIGVMYIDGTVDLNPDPTRRFVEGDRLIMVADDRRPPAKTAGVNEMLTSNVSSLTSVNELASPHGQNPPEHMLIIGWNALGPQLVTQLASLCAPGSTAEVLYDSQLVDEDAVELPSTIPGLELTSTAIRVKNLQRLAKVSDPALTSIILLGYRHGISPGEADSRTLLTLMLIRQELDARGGAAPRLIVELLDAENVDLAITSGADDFVVSNAIASRFITQLAELPERRTVMMHLYADKGASIDLIDASALGVMGQMEFHELVRTVYSFGFLAVGWRRDSEVTLNPAAADVVQLGDADQVVVITK